VKHNVALLHTADIVSPADVSEMAKVKKMPGEKWQFRPPERQLQPALQFIKEVEFRYNPWDLGPDKLARLREFLLLFHSQRRHKEGQKAIIREVLLPLGSKPEISFQWVNGKQRVYDPREVSPDEVLWDLKFIRDKMEIDLVAEEAFRKYDFDTGTETAKEKKPKRAKKKDKVK